LDSSAGVVTGNILIVIFICIPFVRMIFFNRKVPEEKARRAVRTLGIIYFGIYFLWFLYIYILQDWFVFNYYLSNAFIFLINLPPVLYLQLGLSQLLEKPTQEDIELLSGFCGKYDLTERETELVKLICDGRTNSEISEILFVSLQTVKNSVHQIFRKTGVRTRVNLINKVREE